MTQRELREMEKLLEDDLDNMPEAVLERVRGLVKKFLLHEAGRLTGRQVRDEKQILDLIQTHARVGLLQKLVNNPIGFNQKDMKELFRSIGDEKALERADAKRTQDPIQLISGLNVDDQTKAELVSALTEVAAAQTRERFKGRLTP